MLCNQDYAQKNHTKGRLGICVAVWVLGCRGWTVVTLGGGEVRPTVAKIGASLPTELFSISFAIMIPRILDQRVIALMTRARQIRINSDHSPPVAGRMGCGSSWRS